MHQDRQVMKLKNYLLLKVFNTITTKYLQKAFRIGVLFFVYNLLNNLKYDAFKRVENLAITA